MSVEAGETPPTSEAGWRGEGEGERKRRENNRLERARGGRPGKGREREEPRGERAPSRGSRPTRDQLMRARGSLFPGRRGEGGEAWVTGATHLSRSATSGKEDRFQIRGERRGLTNCCRRAAWRSSSPDPTGERAGSAFVIEKGARFKVCSLEARLLWGALSFHSKTIARASKSPLAIPGTPLVIPREEAACLRNMRGCFAGSLTPHP